MNEQFLDEVTLHGPSCHHLRRMAGMCQLAERCEQNGKHGGFDAFPEVLLSDPMKVHCSRFSWRQRKKEVLAVRDL